MSRAMGSDEGDMRSLLAHRLTAAMRRMALFVIPASAAFVGLGDTIGALIYQTGLFTHQDVLTSGLCSRGPASACWLQPWPALFIHLLRSPRYSKLRSGLPLYASF